MGLNENWNSQGKLCYLWKVFFIFSFTFLYVIYLGWMFIYYVWRNILYFLLSTIPTNNTLKSIFYYSITKGSEIIAEEELKRL